MRVAAATMRKSLLLELYDHALTCGTMLERMARVPGKMDSIGSLGRSTTAPTTPTRRSPTQPVDDSAAKSCLSGSACAHGLLTSSANAGSHLRGGGWSPLGA